MMAAAPAPPVAVVETLTAEGEVSPILVVFDDGRLAWSADPLLGGEPLTEATVDPGLVSAAIEEIDHEVLSGEEWTGERRFGPDARWTHMLLRSGGRVIVDVGSWHEILEANPELVVRATGVEPLGERRRRDVLAAEPEEYRRFRQRWTAVVERLRRLIPTS